MAGFLTAVFDPFVGKSVVQSLLDLVLAEVKSCGCTSVLPKTVLMPFVKACWSLEMLMLLNLDLIYNNRFIGLLSLAIAGFTFSAFPPYIFSGRAIVR